MRSVAAGLFVVAACVADHPAGGVEITTRDRVTCHADKLAASSTILVGGSFK